MQRWPDHIEKLHEALLVAHKMSWIFQMPDGSFIAYGSDCKQDVDALFTVAKVVKFTSRKFFGLCISNGRYYRD